MTVAETRAGIVEVGRRLWERGFVASNDGNISVRIAPDRLLMTPASVSKGFMTADMMVVTDLEGRVVDAAPGRKPSSEALMHGFTGRLGRVFPAGRCAAVSLKSERQVDQDRLAGFVRQIIAT